MSFCVGRTIDLYYKIQLYINTTIEIKYFTRLTFLSIFHRHECFDWKSFNPNTPSGSNSIGTYILHQVKINNNKSLVNYILLSKPVLPRISMEGLEDVNTGGFSSKHLPSPPQQRKYQHCLWPWPSGIRASSRDRERKRSLWSWMEQDAELGEDPTSDQSVKVSR